VNYYERHIGDYLKDTAHLSLLEHGVYSRLLDVYYTRENAIPSDQAARLIGARSKDEREAMQAVLAEFFALDNTGTALTTAQSALKAYVVPADEWEVWIDYTAGSSPMTIYARAGRQ
jgi:uncharacterized protein YdaU (DUF1376 family)